MTSFSLPLTLNLRVFKTKQQTLSLQTEWKKMKNVSNLTDSFFSPSEQRTKTLRNKTSSLDACFLDATESYLTKQSCFPEKLSYFGEILCVDFPFVFEAFRVFRESRIASFIMMRKQQPIFFKLIQIFDRVRHLQRKFSFKREIKQMTKKNSFPS